MKIYTLPDNQPLPLPLLLLADPDIDKVQRYCNAGRVFVGESDGGLVGAYVLGNQQYNSIELLNIAVEERFQGRGYGNDLLQHAIQTATVMGKQKLIVGTGNSSIGQLAFYQKSGFEIKQLVPNYFVENYAEPIWEEGIQCKHLIRLELSLESGSSAGGNLMIRLLEEPDCYVISQAFNVQGWDKPKAQYIKYLEEQRAKKRSVLVAFRDGEFAGYLTICWQSAYPPFSEKGIPEVVDFNVLKKFQRRGIGTQLMDEAEQRIGQVSEQAGIGVGVTADYGPAQILYVLRGYLPDGNGLCCAGCPLEYGAEVKVDDGLVLYFLKRL